MRPGEFWEAMAASNAEILAERRHLGELVRGATLRLWNLQVNKKDRISDVRKFWPMWWDDLDEEAHEIKRLGALSEEEANAEAEKFFTRVKNGKV